MSDPKASAMPEYVVIKHGEVPEWMEQVPVQYLGLDEAPTFYRLKKTNV